MGFPESPRPSVDGNGEFDLADFEERGDDASNSLQMLVDAVDHDVVEFAENPVGRLKARARDVQLLPTQHARVTREHLQFACEREIQKRALNE